MNPMSISTDSAEAWTRLLTEQAVTDYIQLRTGQGTVDFVTSERSVDTPVDTSLIGIAVNYNRDEIDGTLIQQNDLKVTVDATVVINETNKILVDSKVYRIVELRQTNIAGTLAGYTLQVRA